MKINPTTILEMVLSYYDMDLATLKSQTREMNIVKVRHLAMRFLREYTELTLLQIGLIFNRDHASVMHAITSVGWQVETNKRYRREYEELIKILEPYAEAIPRIYTEEMFMENDCYV